MANNYLLLLVLCLLCACSSNRFISVKIVPVGFSSPLTQSTLNDYDEIANLAEANIAVRCEALTEDYSPGFELYILQLACAERWLASEIDGHEQAIKIYNSGVEQLVRAFIAGIDTDKHNFELVVIGAIDGEYPFEQLTIATDVIPTDSYMHPHINSDVGVSVVGKRKNSLDGLDIYYPTEGVFRPITVTAKTQKSDMSPVLRVHLQFHLMELPRKISFGNLSHQLTYDLATPLLMLTEAGNIDSYELTGLFRSQDVEEKLGLYALERLSSEKKPILMIHGLNSSPLIWRRLSWAIYSDPELSAKYQIWHAFYPSGPPPFFNAMRLRMLFNELLDEVFPADERPEAPFVWLIGHSMGGIISRTFVVDSENKLWDKAFNVRSAQLGVPALELAEIEDIFKFSTQPTIEGVVFIDTPHKGSEQATGFIARLVSAAITLPKSMSRSIGLLWKAEGNNYITPEMRPYVLASGPDSVRALSPKNPLLMELSQLPPTAKSVSIIGSNRLADCSTFTLCPDLTDGVVHYASAHLPSATRELIVQSKHNSYQSVEAIAFILEELKGSLSQK